MVLFIIKLKTDVKCFLFFIEEMSLSFMKQFLEEK